MLSNLTPAFKLAWIYALEAQSIPAPLSAKSWISYVVGFDLIA
jgi:hypothetical protein